MDNNMLKIDVSSKALETFIDAISRGIGVLYEPTRIRKEAKAKAEEKVILAKAEKQEREILAAVQPLVGDSVSLEQLQPVISKMISDELRKKENIDAVVNIALEDFSKSQKVPEEKADTDWLTRFFNIVENVSDEELRNTWGKILSREIQTPGSYSLRTLSTISNLSKKEAELFASLGNYVFTSSKSKFFLKSHDLILGSNIQYADITLLMECGLIKENEEMGISYEAIPDEDMRNAFAYQDLAIIIERSKGAKEVSISIYELTIAGAEIYKILDIKKDMSFLEKAAAIFKSPNVRFGYSKLIDITNDSIRILRYNSEDESWSVDDSQFVVPANFRTAAGISQTKVLETIRRKKSAYLNALVESQLKAKKIVPSIELLLHQNSESEEDAFIFTLGHYRNDMMRIVYENVNEARSTVVFVVRIEDYTKALMCIFNFMRSREVNKRRGLHYMKYDFKKSGVMTYNTQVSDLGFKPFEHTL